MPRLYPGSDLKAGQVFSCWTVISSAERRNSRAYYNCRCECGTVKIVTPGDLVAGKSKSCGKCGKYRAKKGLRITEHPLYSTWASIKSRCYNSATTGYENYGGRGITVCKEWRDDFRQFAADMGPRPPRHSIDKRDNNGNYCPENCRWATRVTQSNNRRNNRRFTINGETKTLAQWAELHGIQYNTVYMRMSRSKWTLEKALSEPLIVGHPKAKKSVCE